MLAALSVVVGLQLAQAPAPGWPASAGPAPRLGPQADAMESWLARRRRLRIDFGVSAGALGLSAVGLGLFVALRRCGGEEETVCEPPIGIGVTGAAVAASLVATVVFMVRLVAHAERRPARRVGFAGGLSVRF